MKKLGLFAPLLFALLTAITRPLSAQTAPPEDSPTIADILGESGDLSLPENRMRAAERVRLLQEQRRAAAEQMARARGLPLRVERPDGAVRELVDFDGDHPVYLATHNTNAALSTGASVLRLPPYALSGAGVTVGVWDGGAVRAAHQEFAAGGRVVVKDGAASIDHATHVAGTIAAAGVVASARGMATAALVDSYDWNSDKSEMTARGATAPGQTDKLYLSNHSYGYIAGWNYVGGAGGPARVWEWNGDGAAATAFDTDFGRYNTYARDSDALAYNAPYLLVFRSAGNDRVDTPAAGQAVALSPGSATVVPYDPSLHPAGDSVYRGGFETIGFDALAKNVITIGSVTDAVSNGVRDSSKAAVSSFSSWGPTDDGRIKPDLVANGDGVYSALNSSDTAYGSLSGTSMATPNAAGTAALLVQEYAGLFGGGAMRAATLKALLIHTADDRGHAGPDYKFGWGLLNGQAAADLLRDHAANPLAKRVTEGVVNASAATVNLDFLWDGVGPIRATLVWTDPAGAATTTSDLRTPRLVNNLDLKIVAPNGTEYLPYVMPFVGAWTAASMDQPATTGKNNTDNVEQVHLAAPPLAGAYRVVVSLSGALANTEQRYSLLLSGSANQEPPPPPLGLASISPSSALPALTRVSVGGRGFQAGMSLVLRRPGQADIAATDLSVGSDSLVAWFDLAGAAPGAWDLVAVKSGGESATLAGSFTVLAAVWSETFDGAVGGWTSGSSIGANAWTLGATLAHTPSRAYFAPAPSSKTTTALVSPVVAIPAGANNLQLRFWHRHDFSSGDCGKLEISVDGGATWLDVNAGGSGAAFASNGYNGTVSGGGNPNSRNEFAGQAAWVGASGAFVETVVNLADTARFAGKSFRARWRIATNASGASPGWYVDTISLTGGGNLANAAPVISSGPSASVSETVADPDGTVYTVLRGRDLTLSVAATDDGGEPVLTYVWSASSVGRPPVFFSPNASNPAKVTLAGFESAGDYLVTVAVRDAAGLTTTASLPIRVAAVPDAIVVEPAVASVVYGGSQAFGATLLDQFGAPVSPQPASFAWTASGGGAVDAAGLFAASAAGGPHTITAASGGLSGVASVTVNRAPAAVLLSGLERTYSGAPLPVEVATSPAGLSVSVTYDGLGVAPGAVGAYAVVATVTDPDHQGVAGGTLVIRTGFDRWAEARGLVGGTAAPDADPDADGASNFLEYALGGDPLVAGPASVEATLVEGRLALVFTRVADPGLVYTVEASDDLARWTTLDAAGNPSAGATNVAGPAFIVDPREIPAPARRFLRLRVAY